MEFPKNVVFLKYGVLFGVKILTEVQTSEEYQDGELPEVTNLMCRCACISCYMCENVCWQVN